MGRKAGKQTYSKEDAQAKVLALLEQGATHEDIRQKLHSIWNPRNDQYSMLRKSGSATGASPRNSQKVEMSYIGG